MLRHETDVLRIFALTLLMAGLIVFLSACSSDNVPTTAPLASADPSEFHYPELTPEFLEHALPAGYRVVPIPTTLDACDSAQASAFCHWNQQKTINISHFIEFTYYPNLMPCDTTIQIVAPNRCVPVADFYPHPTQFSGMVKMKFKIHEMGYDRVVNPATLAMFYYNENTGVCEPLPFTWEGNYQCLIVYTDHFSRYIISAPTE
jgi:hypothetical protein